MIQEEGRRGGGKREASENSTYAANGSCSQTGASIEKVAKSHK